jgi:hypothetical protein
LFSALLAISMDARAQEPAITAGDPAVVPILKLLGEYCTQLRKDFHNYVAEERDTQKRYKRSGELDRERHILADYYMVSLPSAPTEQTDFREVLEVDGKKVGRSRGALLKLLTKPSRDLPKEYDRLKRESNRYELLWGSAFLSSVALVLPMYGLPENQTHTAYSLAAGEPQAPDQWIVDFHEVGTQTILWRSRRSQSSGPLPASGRFYLAKPDGRILRAEISVNLPPGDAAARLRYVVEYQPDKDNHMLPGRRLVFVYDPKWQNSLIAESEATYSNFRRFSANSRIVSWEVP